MFLIKLLTAKAVHDSMTLHILDGVSVEFHLGRSAQGLPCMKGEFPDDHPRADEVRARAAQVNILIETTPGVAVRPPAGTAKGLGVSERAGTVQTNPTGIDPALTAGRPTVSQDPLDIVAALHANGWRDEDIVGVCLTVGGDLGVSGGVNRVTGLCAVELLASAAPAGWSEVAALRYPWELPGWKAPSDEWRAPNVAPKAQPVLPSQGTADVANKAPDAPVEEETPPPPPVDAPKAAPAVESVASDHLAIGPYGTADQVAKAIAIIKGLTTDKGAPSHQKASANLRVAGLPSVTKDSLALLLK